MPCSSVDDPIEVGNFYRDIGGGVREVVEIKDGRISYIEHHPVLHLSKIENGVKSYEARAWTAVNEESFLSLEASRTLARLEKA